MFLSILELAHYGPHIAHGLTLVTPSFYEWEAFPKPGALTHTRITWALSPTASKVPGVTPASLSAHGLSGTAHGEMRDTNFLGNVVILEQLDKSSVVKDIKPSNAFRSVVRLLQLDKLRVVQEVKLPNPFGNVVNLSCSNNWTN